MSPVSYLKDVRIVHDGPHVPCGERAVRERERGVQRPERKRRVLQLDGLLADLLEKRAEEPLL